MNQPSTPPASDPTDDNPNISQGQSIETFVNTGVTGTGQDDLFQNKFTRQGELIRNTSQSALTAKSAHHHNYRSAPYVKPKGGYPATRKPPGQGKSRLDFLLDTPTLDYFLPPGDTINATLAEIIVLLPHWFKNRDLAVRFQNNGITAAVHFEILKEYRDMELSPRGQYERPFEHITDMYRKTMRKIDVNWTKARHAPPADWSPTFMMINNFLPESAHEPGYIMPAPIPFKELATNLKKLPQAYDAGDITRALDHAMNYQKWNQKGQLVDFLFPDDIHMILDHIGRTLITVDHTDRYIVERYNRIVKLADHERRQRLQAEKEQKKLAEQMVSQPTRPFQYYHHPQPRDLQSRLAQPVHLPRQGNFPQQPSTQKEPLPDQDPWNNVVEQPFASQQTYVALPNFPCLNGEYNGLPDDSQQDFPAPAKNISSLDVGYGGLPPIGEYAYPLAIRDVHQNNGHHTSTGAELGSNNNFSMFPIMGSSFQKAAAEIAIRIASQSAEHVAYDEDGLPPVPSVCKLEPDPNQLRLGLNAYGQPADQQDEPINLEGFDINSVMTATQSYEPAGLPTPSPESNRSHKYHPSDLLRDCHEGSEEDDSSDLARASRWARRDGVSACKLTVADLEMVIGLVDQIGGEVLALREKK
jgi:hypothetical protein